MFEVHVQDDGRFAFKGRLDSSKAEIAAAALARVSGSTVIDCSGLDYISSAGLGVLILTYRRLSATGHGLRLTGLQPRVRSIFRMANLEELLGVE